MGKVHNKVKKVKNLRLETDMENQRIICCREVFHGIQRGENTGSVQH